MRFLSLALLISASFLGGGDSPPPKVQKAPNPYEAGTEDWVRHEMEHLSQSMDAAQPGAGRKVRQDTNLAFLEVGMMYKVAELGIGERRISRAGPNGSTTTYIHKIGDGYTYVTVDDATWIVMAINRGL